MARQRLERRERSEAILEATLALFAKQGCSGATTRQIARAAGVSEALVFKHFPTKQTLYRAILERQIRESERMLPLDHGLRGLDDEAFFVRIAMVALRRVEKDDAFLRLFLHSALEDHDLFRRFHNARVEKLLATIEERIRSMMHRRTGRAGIDPALAARAFNGMLLSALLGRHIFEERVIRLAPIDRVAKTLVKVFLHGITREARDRA